MRASENKANHTIARLVVEDRDTSMVNGGEITAFLANQNGGRRGNGNEGGRGEEEGKSKVEERKGKSEGKQEITDFFSFYLTPGKISNLALNEANKNLMIGLLCPE